MMYTMFKEIDFFVLEQTLSRPTTKIYRHAMMQTSIGLTLLSKKLNVPSV